jgi:hypothetical protein
MITLEAGKSYRDKTGKVWGPLKKWGFAFSSVDRRHVWDIHGNPDSANTAKLIALAEDPGQAVE